jgi:transposase
VEKWRDHLLFKLNVTSRMSRPTPHRHRRTFHRHRLLRHQGQKYTLLSRRENLTLDGKKALKTLLAANKRLNTAYVLKESFGQLWSYEREGWARRRLVKTSAARSRRQRRAPSDC